MQLCMLPLSLHFITIFEHCMYLGLEPNPAVWVSLTFGACPSLFFLPNCESQSVWHVMHNYAARYMKRPMFSSSTCHLEVREIRQGRQPGTPRRHCRRQPKAAGFPCKLLKFRKSTNESNALLCWHFNFFSQKAVFHKWHILNVCLTQWVTGPADLDS